MLFASFSSTLDITSLPSLNSLESTVILCLLLTGLYMILGGEEIVLSSGEAQSVDIVRVIFVKFIMGLCDREVYEGLP